jgi:hypothetical protein
LSRNYLPEYAENARLALAIAEKEAAHLGYSHRTLYAHAIDLKWVEALSQRDDLSEKIDAFVGRFGRLQDHIGEKLVPRFAALVGENTKTMLDALAFAERMEWIEDAEAFFGARKLRNLLVHEYLTDPALFLEALQAADQAAQMLMVTVARVAQYAGSIGLSNSP